MTMGLHELDSFVKKFVSLWRSGCEANLQVQSRAGNAYVNLQLGLGQADVHVYPPAAGVGGCRGGGPARQRRRTRREAERQSRSDAEQADGVFIENRNDIKAKSTEEVNDIVSKESIEVNIAETTLEIDEIGHEIEKVPEKEESERVVEEETEIIVNNALEIEEIKCEVEKVPEKEVSEKVVEEDTENIVDNAKEVTDTAAVAIASKGCLENTVPPVVKIHATAVIDNSPNEALSNDDINSVAKILTNRDHLAQNILNIEYSYLSTREIREKFKHSVGIVISVQTCNLWEGARSYIYRHTGRDTWTLRNGSVVNIARIHQK